MKTVTLQLPDNVAYIFDSMSSERKANAALLTACIAKSQPVILSNIFAKIDEKVAKSGLSEEEIENLLNELS